MSEKHGGPDAPLCMPTQVIVLGVGQQAEDGLLDGFCSPFDQILRRPSTLVKSCGPYEPKEGSDI